MVKSLKKKPNQKSLLTNNNSKSKNYFVQYTIDKIVFFCKIHSMKRGVSIKPFQFFAILVLATLTSRVSAQLPGDGGGIDSNPFNPLNWNCDYEVTYDGNTTFSGVKETSPGTYQNYTKVYQWGNPVGPYDDAAKNEAPNSNHIEAKASGTISKRIKMISARPTRKQCQFQNRIVLGIFMQKNYLKA